MSEIKLFVQDPESRSFLTEKFPQFQFELVIDNDNSAVCFCKKKGKLGIQSEGEKALFLDIDFFSSELQRRRKFFSNKKENLLKAIGPKAKNLNIFEATAGLGRESYLLASAGYNVIACEKSPYLYVLLCLALDNLYEKLNLNEDQRRLKFLFGDAVELLRNNTTKIDVIYADPMFPQAKKSALVKKNMQVLHKMDLSDDKPLELLNNFKEVSEAKIVFKRPSEAPVLDESACKEYYENDTIRFEVY